MKKSNTWQFIGIVLLVLVALFVVLNIDHPEWAENLILWRLPDEREITLHKGLDLGGGTQYVLAADAPAGEEIDPATVEAARDVIEARATDLSLSEPVVELRDSGRGIIVQLPDVAESGLVTESLQATGRLEFVNLGILEQGELQMAIGITIETSSSAPPAVDPLQPSMPATTTTPSPAQAPQGYETVLTRDDLSAAFLSETEAGYYLNLRFVPTEEAAARLTAYAQQHAGETLAVVMDSALIGGAPLPQDLTTTDSTGQPGVLSVPIYLLGTRAETAQTVLNSGSLPVPLSIQEKEAIGPTLGQETVQRAGRAALAGLVATFLLLIVHYRLPGLLTAVGLFAFALFCLALCKLIPLPVTMVTLVGFAVAGLACLSGQLNVAERLRTEVRLGRPPHRAVEDALGSASPPIRRAHVALLLISVALWYIGARFSVLPIHRMGTTLLVGTLTSAFVALVFARVVAHLALDGAQPSLSERKWLMGS